MRSPAALRGESSSYQKVSDVARSLIEDELLVPAGAREADTVMLLHEPRFLLFCEHEQMADTSSSGPRCRRLI